MAKPLKLKFNGGIATFVQKGDTYKDPNGQEKMYENTKLMVAIAGQPKAFELPKDAYDALDEFFQTSEVQQKMKDWV